MGNYDDKIVKPLASVAGGIIGQDLLPAVKAAMIVQPVFQKLFGTKGERIFITKVPSYNDTIIPLIELRWKGERWQSQNTRVYGSIFGMIVLPVDFGGHTDRFRGIAAAFMRWIESRHTLFSDVPGLIEIGTNADFKYDNSLRTGGNEYPVIDFTLPVVFDLAIYRKLKPDVDLNAALDAEVAGWMETYNIRITDEEGGVLIDTQTLSETGLSQDDE